MEKNNLHPRNRHRARYDFKNLCAVVPELSKCLIKNKYNNEDTINFSDSLSVKLLNKALLKFFYGISYWDIPKNYLCPPIPGRADYIHYAADLLMSPTRNENIRVLDIGVGANCIYPLIGHKEYGWSFVGAEVSEEAFISAKSIVEKNGLTNAIEMRKQVDQNAIFSGIIKPTERFDLTICNPPFHSSKEEAIAGTSRKNKNLKVKNQLNFGGHALELWCEGGEEQFIKKMIAESKIYKENCKWFSTLVSSKENLSTLYGELKRIEAKNVQTFEMSQGQKISRFIAWSF